MEQLTHTAVCQIGIVVHDIRKAIEKYAAMVGVKAPDIMETDAYEKAGTEYRGKPTKARAKLAFFHVSPGLDLEFIEPDTEPSTWREYLDSHGPGIHHVAIVIRGMGKNIELCMGNGLELDQKGEYTGGRYAYLNGVKDLGMMIELLENDQ